MNVDNPADILDWLTTNRNIVIAVAGVVAAAVVPVIVWLIHVRSGFRPRATALIDDPRERILVTIRNVGGSSGQVDNVSVLSQGQLVPHNWLCGQHPQNHKLVKHSTVRFLAEAVDCFPADAKVTIRVNGRDKIRRPRRKPYSWDCSAIRTTT